MIGSSFQSSLYLRSPSNLYAIGSSFQSKLKPLSSHQLLEIGSSFQSSLNLWSLSNLYAIRSSFSEHAEPPGIPPTVRDRKLLSELTESPIAQQSVCNLNESDPRSNVHYLSSSENKAFFHNDQLLVGFLAQLVERCTGISEVMEFFSGLIFTSAQVVLITARITFIQVFIRSSNIWLSYILSCMHSVCNLHAICMQSGAPF